MHRDHDEIVACLRTKSVAELSGYVFNRTPSFLAAMGPSEDGVLIPDIKAMTEETSDTQFMTDALSKVRRVCRFGLVRHRGFFFRPLARLARDHIHFLKTF